MTTYSIETLPRDGRHILLKIKVTNKLDNSFYFVWIEGYFNKQEDKWFFPEPFLALYNSKELDPLVDGWTELPSSGDTTTSQSKD